MKKIILWLKMHHWIPVYRKDILEYAKDRCEKMPGLCLLLKLSIGDFNLSEKWKVVIFHLFNIDNALSFGANKKRAFWWKIGDWSGGRKEFLNWLIDQYKDDKEDLRKYKAE